MSPGTLDERSERLALLVDGLGAALRDGGVADEAAARVLENASAAVLDALTLDLMFPDDPAPPVARGGEPRAAKPALTVAA